MPYSKSQLHLKLRLKTNSIVALTGRLVKRHRTESEGKLLTDKGIESAQAKTVQNNHRKTIDSQMNL